jgi:ribosomal protein L15E
MTLSVLKSGVLNIYYVLSDDSQKVFEVPLNIIDPKKSEIKDDAKLSDYI